jgi:thiamine-phosphate pyrophosphorylase
MALHRISVGRGVTLFSQPIVCLVTDRRRLASTARTVRAELTALDQVIDEAIAAGVDLVQVRERDLDAAPLVSFVRGVVARAAGTSTRVVVNDRADVAVVSGAGGVHVRSDGPAVDRVRALVAPGDPWIVGRSCHAGDPASVAADAD